MNGDKMGLIERIYTKKERKEYRSLVYQEWSQQEDFPLTPGVFSLIDMLWHQSFERRIGKISGRSQDQSL